MKTKNKINKTLYMPRVVINMNTGTHVIKTKKDKMNSRQALNKKTREAFDD